MKNWRHSSFVSLFGLIALLCFQTAHSNAQSLSSYRLNGNLGCADRDRVEVKTLGKTMLEVKGHNSCRANQIIAYSLNDIGFKTAADTFGNFHFIVTLSQSVNRLSLTSLTGEQTPVYTSNLGDRGYQTPSGLTLQPASLILDGPADDTFKLHNPIINDLTETGLDIKPQKTNTQIMLTANAFSASDASEGIQPLPFADPPLSLSKPVTKSKLLVEPVQPEEVPGAETIEAEKAVEIAVEEKAEETVSEPIRIEPEIVKLEPVKSEASSLVPPKTSDSKPVSIPEGEEVRVELVWTAPVDLDLHVFEPGYKGDPTVVSKSAFHISEKNNPGGFLSLTQPNESEGKKRYKETYRRSIKALRKGVIRLALSYQDRSAGLPDTCGTGRFAAIPALAKIKTPDFSRSELVLINPVSCDAVKENATLLIDIAEITLD